MAKIKPTQLAADRILDRLSHMKARLVRMESVAKVKTREEWPTIKAQLEDLAKTHDRGVTAVVESGEHLDDHDRCRQIDVQKAQRDVFNYVIHMFERPEQEAETLRDTVARLEDDLKEKREELAAIGE